MGDAASFFDDDAVARACYDAVVARLPPGSDVRVQKSQIGFWRAHPFAAVWRPSRVLRGEVAPLVLSVFLRHRDGSPRFKEIVEPRPGRFTHHLELWRAADVDDDVAAVLAAAAADAETKKPPRAGASSSRGRTRLSSRRAR